MPGTYGSVLGVGLYLVLAASAKPLPHPQLILALAVLAVAAVSVGVISVAQRSFTSHDPQQIVLDEVAGQLLALLPLPLVPTHQSSYWMAVGTAFVLFRALDAAKPYPIWKLERLPGAWGVVCDDLAAGALAALLLTSARCFGWKM